MAWKTVALAAIAVSAALAAAEVSGSSSGDSGAGGWVGFRNAMESAIAYIEASGDNAILIYLLLTFVGVVLLIPTTPLEFAGGFLFGARYGVWTTWALTSAAKLVANVISVWLARHIFRDVVRRHLVEKWEVLRLVSAAVTEEPFKMAFLVRGSMVPLCVKNYGLGVLDIGYIPIASAACIFTPFYAYQNIYFGSACQDLKDIFAPRESSSSAGEEDWKARAKSVLPLAFNVCLVLFLIRAVKQQIKKSRTAMEATLKAKVAEKKVD